MEEKRKRPKKTILLIFLLLIAGGTFIFLTEFQIRKIEVEGNVRYTKKEIQQIVIANEYFDNTVLLWLKERFRPIEDVPFIESMEIEIINQNSIKVRVFEKALAGCIAYMGEYVYFDRDGYILESSDERFADIPCVMGLPIDGFVLHQKLPIEDQNTFALILNLTQMIQKYKLNIDKMCFDLNDNIIIYKDNITILLGKEENIEEKIAILPNVLEAAEGFEGILHLEDYNSETKLIRFVNSTSDEGKKSHK